MTKRITIDTTLWYEKSLDELAKDLHDGVSHQLVIILWELERLKSIDDRDNMELKLNQLTDQLRGTINEVQQIIYGVKPVDIDDMGLVEAIHSMVIRQLNSQNIQFQLFQECDSFSLSRFTAGQVYRIIQEGVNNILSHSGAKLVTLMIQHEGSNLLLELSDDGRGFDDSASPGPGLGLQTMRERAQMIHGQLEIHSTRGAGTALKLIIPDRGDDVK